MIFAHHSSDVLLSIFLLFKYHKTQLKLLMDNINIIFCNTLLSETEMYINLIVIFLFLFVGNLQN